jgi:hypothetical protein
MALLFLALFVCCMSAADRDNYSLDECFLAADCMYRLKDSQDKSACADLQRACSDALKEKRQRQLLEYCSQNKFNNMTENECRLYLNQK